MFDCDDGVGELGRLTGDQLAARVSANHTRLLECEAEVLVLACAWADLCSLDPAGGEYQPLINRSCVWGGEGTPELSEYAAAEFGTLQGIGMVTAKLLIADALDLRHRLPRLWAQVTAGQVRAWQARKVAQATHALSWEAARDVDGAISGYIAMLSWPRFQRVLTAAIEQADPDLVRERAERARAEKMVWLSDAEHGLKTLVAKVASGDGVWFMATVNRIADILARQGDLDPIGARRAKAIGILAQPARALKLLIDHQDDPDPTKHPDPDVSAAGEGDSRDPEPGPSRPAPSPSGATQDRRSGHPSWQPGDRGDGNSPNDDPGDEGGEGDGQPMGGWGDGDRDWPVGADDDHSAEAHSSGGQAERGEDWDTGPGHGHTSLVLDPATVPVEPAVLDPVSARPRVVLYFHLSDAVMGRGWGLVRPEHGPPVTLVQLKQFLTDSGCQVRVQPVIDPAQAAPVDGYEIPESIRAAVRLRNPVDVFPYGTCTSRSMDYDHTRPYTPRIGGGPTGRTAVDNLGPMSRSSHRAVTHGRWGKRQPDPGSYAFRSPHGHIYLVTNQGTLALGNTPFAHAIWKAAVPDPARAGPSAQGGMRPGPIVGDIRDPGR